MRKAWYWVKAFLQAFPKWFGLYLGLSGLVMFNLFIMEEGFQTTMFATWPAQDAGEWRLVKKSLAVMQKSHDALVFMNKCGGWLNPFSYISYDFYAQSEEAYIAGLKAKAFANAPELFAGEKMTFSFKFQEKEFADGHMILRNGRCSVLTKEEKPEYTGVINVNGDAITVDAR
ncbi:MAG: hypothetical protein CSYNP_01623 [Syntrophus sp. SKADARSKE-3]|nr:hypothetical protein [Syntrophus sp. SKADARSKE-3]